MPKPKDLTGARFGRLSVISLSRTERPDATHYRRFWKCQCDCGVIKEVVQDALISGGTQSCGCFKKENPNGKTHGKTGTPTHKIWCGMKKRCYQESSQPYYKYGGRGIKICQRWLDDFLNFLEDMGERPPGMTIERIENDKDYEPGNCRWATNDEQAKNKRNTVRVGGICLSDYAAANGLNYKSLHYQHRMRGLPIEQAVLLATPISK